MPQAQNRVLSSGERRDPSRQEQTITSSAGVPARAATIAGGYISVPTEELCAVWGALLAGAIEAFDVRTWLAAREARERRRFARKGCRPRYELEELLGLVGGGEARLRSSLRRLERAGLVRWSTSQVDFIAGLEALPLALAAEAQAMLDQMPRSRHHFPMPRRMLRLLAGGVKRSVLATVFAHLVRCPHYTKGEGWDGAGTCKASWIAETFGIGERSAIRARIHLIKELGWLRPIATPQARINRFGGRFEVNLAWNGEELLGCGGGEEGSPGATSVLAPPRAPIVAVLAPPIKEQPSSTKIDLSTLGAERAPAPAAKPVDVRRTKERPGKPSLRKVVREDLRDVGRVMELFDEALESPFWRGKGWTPTDTPSERLNWAAAAYRARVRGGTNPCGLFVHLVSNRLWNHVTQGDEEAIRLPFSHWQNPEPEAFDVDTALFGRPKPARALSADGLVLRRIEDALRTRGVVPDPRVIERELLRSGWSIERVEEGRRVLAAWKAGERALAELAC